MSDRVTGHYRIVRWQEGDVRAFVPNSLPPQAPRLQLDDEAKTLVAQATAALEKLAIAGDMVPDANWFLYGFARKEALVSSQIEGTQATLQDVLALEAGATLSNPQQAREVCNYVKAIEYARDEIARPNGLPISRQLLCEAHRRLMPDEDNKQPGEIRRSQNWIGGTRPGNAHFVPPPPDELTEALSSLERYIHATDDLPALVRVGLAHVQFETIHPFLDGNGRIGRLLITLLVEHWGLLRGPLLYVSVPFKQQQAEYYARLDGVRLRGDWEGWIKFFLRCVTSAAQDAVAAAQRLFRLTSGDLAKITAAPDATVSAVRLMQLLPRHPVITPTSVRQLLGASKPTVTKAIDFLCRQSVLRQIGSARRNRSYVYSSYMEILSADAAPGQ